MVEITEPNSKFTMILFSGDYDKAMAAFTLANGAAGNGMDVAIFFTFWGVSLLRHQTVHHQGFLENMFKTMLPMGPAELGLSKMNFGGIGAQLMEALIHQKKGQTLDDLFKMAQDRKIHFIACEASLKLLGIEPAELIPYERLEISGVDTFLKNASESKISLFI
jgi:peroxiredoxin family protein